MSLNRIFSLLALVVCVAFAAVLLYLAFPDDEISGNSGLSAADIVPLQKDTSHESAPSLPVRLKIPSIGVDAPFEYVGLTSKGLVGAPKSANKVGWYKLSPRPGEAGNSIVDGHAGYSGGRSAVFYYFC